MIAAILFRFLAWLCRNFSPDKARGKLDFLAKLYYRVDFRKRKHIYQNLTLLIGSQQAQTATPKVYHQFAYFLFEFFSRHPAKIHNKDLIQQKALRELGKPREKATMVLMGHYGNWEVGLRHLLEFGYEVTTITMHHSHPKVDAFFEEMRYHPNLECHDLSKGVAPILQAVKQKRIIALACERDYTSNGYELQLNDLNFKFPKGPAFLMKKFKLPTFIFEQERLELLNFNYDLNPLTPIQKGESLEDLSLRIAKAVFEVILKRPDQWLTFDPYFTKSNHS